MFALLPPPKLEFYGVKVKRSTPNYRGGTDIYGDELLPAKTCIAPPSHATPDE